METPPCAKTSSSRWFKNCQQGCLGCSIGVGSTFFFLAILILYSKQCCEGLFPVITLSHSFIHSFILVPCFLKPAMITCLCQDFRVIKLRHNTPSMFSTQQGTEWRMQKGSQPQLYKQHVSCCFCCVTCPSHSVYGHGTDVFW